MSWYYPKVNGEFTASLVDLARTVERKTKEFAADVNASIVDELATRELAELLRNNVRSFKQRIETFGVLVNDAIAEEAARGNPLVDQFNQQVSAFARLAGEFGVKVAQALDENPVIGQTPDFVAYDALVAQFRDLVTQFGNDLAAQAPTLPLPEREALLESFENLIKSFEDLLRSRLDLIRQDVDVAVSVRFAPLQKLEGLIKSFEDLLLSLEQLIQSLIDLVFKPVQKIEELFRSLEDLIKSFRELGDGSHELALLPLQKREELLISLETLVQGLERILLFIPAGPKDP